MNRLLIVRHIDIEGPGSFGKFATEEGCAYQIFDAYDNKPDALSEIDLSDIGGIVLLGGPMNVYEEEKYPFLAAEKDLVRNAIEKNIPVLGICLGAQLIAVALGARVRPSPVKEVGWYDVELEEVAKTDPLLKELGRRTKVFQWHEDTFDLPKGAVLLAKNNGINQAFRYKNLAWAFQFHIEVDEEMIKSWYDEYVKDASREGKCSDVIKQYVGIAKDFEAKARTIYRAFISQVH